MADPLEAPAVRSADDADERLLRRAGLAIGVLAMLLAGVVIVSVVRAPVTILEAFQYALMAAVGVTVLVYRRAMSALHERRLARESSSLRILQGLSRSFSPESIVTAIITELCQASGADHVVVSRLRQPDGVLETTLVSASPGVPPSHTTLPGYAVATALGPGNIRALPATARGLRWPGGQAAAEEVARQVRSAYGLPYTLAAPLVADGRLVGALVLSHRTRAAWSDASRRLLEWAAQEVSAALARAYAYEEAETRANIDALTGLPNRRYFDELGEVVRPGRRAGDAVGILMVDIDRFKRLNDRYGHATGDRVLRAVASVIAGTVRAEDTPARYGGEEFAVVLRRATHTQALDVADRLRLAVSRIDPREVGLDEGVTVSVGVAVSAEPGTSFASLVERADAALYAAKRAGRDRVMVA